MDRDARDALADTIAAFMRSEISAREFESRCSLIQSEEEAVMGVAVDMADLHKGAYWWAEEPQDHLISIKEDRWEYLLRTVAFLESELTTREFSGRHVPFVREEDWEEHRRLLAGHGIPEYDPLIHHGRIEYKHAEVSGWMWVPTAVTVLIACGLAAAFLLAAWFRYFD